MQEEEREAKEGELTAANEEIESLRAAAEAKEAEHMSALESAVQSQGAESSAALNAALAAKEGEHEAALAEKEEAMERLKEKAREMMANNKDAMQTLSLIHI